MAGDEAESVNAQMGIDERVNVEETIAIVIIAIILGIGVVAVFVPQL